MNYGDKKHPILIKNICKFCNLLIINELRFISFYAIFCKNLVTY